MGEIHSSAIVSSSANIAEDVIIGPYSVIGDAVTIGTGCVIGPHCNVQGETILGKNNKLYSYCSIGTDSQDKKFKFAGKLVIGDDNIFREFITINRSTDAEGQTVIGDRNLLLAYSHVGHDCTLGSDIVQANNAQIAGHVVIEDRVILGGFVGVHQFCRIGNLAIIGVGTIVRQHVLPYSKYTITGSKVLVAINRIGMQRWQMTEQQISAVSRAFRVLYREGKSLSESQQYIQQQAKQEASLQLLTEFLHNVEQRGIVRPRK